MGFKEFLEDSKKDIKESKVGDFFIDIQDNIYNAIKKNVTNLLYKYVESKNNEQTRSL